MSLGTFFVVSNIKNVRG